MFQKLKIGSNPDKKKYSPFVVFEELGRGNSSRYNSIAKAIVLRWKDQGPL